MPDCETGKQVGRNDNTVISLDRFRLDGADRTLRCTTTGTTAPRMRLWIPVWQRSGLKCTYSRRAQHGVVLLGKLCREKNALAGAPQQVNVASESRRNPALQACYTILLESARLQWVNVSLIATMTKKLESRLTLNGSRATWPA